MGLSIGSTGPPRVGMGHVFMKILGLQVYNYPFDGFSFSATVEPELTYQWSNKNQGSVFQQQPQGVSRCFTDMDIFDTGYFNVGISQETDRKTNQNGIRNVHSQWVGLGFTQQQWVLNG